MRPSIKNHIFRQFFSLSLLTIVLLIVVVELLTGDLEENMVAIEIESEQTHYLSMSHGIPETWVAATTTVSFVPGFSTVYPDLPPVFKKLPVPFSGNVETGEKKYWIDISLTPTGTLYIAKETSLFELRAEVFFFGILIIGGLFIVISFVLTQLSARRIVRPLTRLTEEIANIDPHFRSLRVSDEYHDQELYSIATTFNAHLNTMDEYVKREHMLISMASHELRTPIAVSSGALDVLDDRDTLSKKDKVTVERIRDATNEMNANVVAILMLARKRPVSPSRKKVLLSQLIQSAVQARLDTHPKDQQRLSVLQAEIDIELVVDVVLANMLFKNLIQNALEHTQGYVVLEQNEKGLLISDEGAGLPNDVRLQLEQKEPNIGRYTNESGIGLFIVTLICEHLGWKIEVYTKAETGACLQLYFHMN